MSNCQPASDGYIKCRTNSDHHIFTPGRAYAIITLRPYLVCACNVEGYAAFVDTGFSGDVELCLPSSHRDGIWGDSVLNSMIKDNRSRIFWIGSGYLRRLKSMRIDTSGLRIHFGENVRGQKVGDTKPFGRFENPLFSMGITLRSHAGTMKALGFVDTGNPRTFIMNGALEKELVPLSESSQCGDKCVRVTIEKKDLSLGNSSIALFLNGKRIISNVAKVCSKDGGACRSTHYNKTIRGSHVSPVVSVNVGNDVVSLLSNIVFDYVRGVMYIKTRTRTIPSRQLSVSAVASALTPRLSDDRRDLMSVCGMMLIGSFVAILAISTYLRQAHTSDFRNPFGQ